MTQPHSPTISVHSSQVKGQNCWPRNQSLLLDLIYLPLDWLPEPRSNLLKVTYWISFPLIYRLGENSWPEPQRHWSGWGAVCTAEFLALHFLTVLSCPWSITRVQAITLAEAFSREANLQLCVCVTLMPWMDQLGLLLSAHYAQN